MFNKLSKKIINKVIEKVEKVKKDIDEWIKEFWEVIRWKL